MSLDFSAHVGVDVAGEAPHRAKGDGWGQLKPVPHRGLGASPGEGVGIHVIAGIQPGSMWELGSLWDPSALAGDGARPQLVLVTHVSPIHTRERVLLRSRTSKP